MIDYACPKCKAEMSSPDSMAGQTEACLECGNVTTVPGSRPPQGFSRSVVAPATPPLASPAPAASGFHKQRIAVACAAGAGMAATFLPWVKAPIIGTLEGSAGDGWITFGLYAVSLIAAFLGNTRTLMSIGKRVIAIVPAGLASLIGVWKIADFKNAMADIPTDNPFAQAFAGTVQLGVGLYLVIIAGIAVIILSSVFGSRGAASVGGRS